MMPYEFRPYTASEKQVLREAHVNALRSQKMPWAWAFSDELPYSADPVGGFLEFWQNSPRHPVWLRGSRFSMKLFRRDRSLAISFADRALRAAKVEWHGREAFLGKGAFCGDVAEPLASLLRRIDEHVSSRWPRTTFEAHEALTGHWVSGVQHLSFECPREECVQARRRKELDDAVDSAAKKRDVWELRERERLVRNIKNHLAAIGEMEQAAP